MNFYRIITFPLFSIGFLVGLLSNAYWSGNNKGKDVYYCIYDLNKQDK